MKRAALYVRVSTQEQKNGLSIDSQIHALQQYCKDNDLVEVNIYNDAGISAHSKYTKRPALMQMIRDCQNDLIDIILITKLDRFFRSVKDYYAVMEQIGDINWRAIWEDYETETSSGQFKVNIMLSIAQAESERTSERIKSVIEFKRDRGDYIGSAPVGYLLVKRDLIIDPDKYNGIKALFDTYLSTHSIKKSMEAMQANGVDIGRADLYRLMRNPAYCGNSRCGYKCPAYITEEQFTQICAELDSKRIYRSPKQRTYIFSSMIVCGECGRKFVGRTQVQGNNEYKWYACNGKASGKCSINKTISEKKLEDFLLRNIDFALREYTFNAKLADAKSDNSDLIKKLEAKLKRIGIRFEEGDISAEEYKQKKEAVKAEIAALQPQSLDRPIPELPGDWKEVYQQLNDSSKQAFWRSVVHHIAIDRNGSLDIIF